MSLLERGFKTWSEKTSLTFRKDLNLSADSALDPRALAVKMGVLVWTAEFVAEHGNLAQEHLDQLIARTGPWRPPIPIDDDHPFQSMTTTGSDL